MKLNKKSFWKICHETIIEFSQEISHATIQ